MLKTGRLSVNSELRYLAATRVSSTGDDIFIPTADTSGCYYFDCSKGRFIHVDFETEVANILTWKGFKTIKGTWTINTIVALPNQSEEMKFIMAIQEVKSANLFITLLSANSALRNVYTHAEHLTGITRVEENDYFILQQSSSGKIYLIVYRINKETRKTKYSVSLIEIDQISNNISSKVLCRLNEIGGLWMSPFVDDAAIYFMPMSGTFDRLTSVALNGRDVCNVSVCCACKSCKNRSAHSFDKNSFFGHFSAFDTKVFFPVINGSNCSIWSLKIESKDQSLSKKGCLRCEERIDFIEKRDKPFYCSLKILPDGSAFLFARSHIFHTSLSISENYELDHVLLGKGAYGSVVKGTICGRGSVAIKIMNSFLNVSKALHKKIIMSAVTEARKLSTVTHMNVVKGLGFKMEGNRFLLFMELMKESIRHVIERTSEMKLQESESLLIMQQALEGLVHLHTLKPKPIVHRDIKCLNLLISETGIVKLGDLGLVHTVALSERGSTDPVFAPKEVAGTAYWQAPEVLKSSTTKTYGRKADVWSMGCCLVEMMTGYPPYFDKTVTQVQWVIKMSDGTLTYDPKELLPQASPDAISLLQKVFRRSTKKSPDNMLVRPHSWEILTDIIEINELLPLKERLSRVEMKIDALRSLTKEKENDDK